MTDLSQPDGAPLIRSGDDLPTDLIDDMTRGTFLPFITIVQPNSDASIDQKASPGEMLFGPEDNMGREFVGIAVAYRQHAMLFDDKRNVLLESFNPESPTFQKIKVTPKSKTRRPNVGYDILLYALGRGFGTLYFKNTATKGGRPIFNHMKKKCATRVSTLLVGKSNKWYVPIPTEYEGALDEADRPTDAVIAEALKMFVDSAKENDGSSAPEAAPEGRDR